MAPNLPGLPAEILLVIKTECPRGGNPRYYEKPLFENLRATCRELHGKLTPFYGARYLREMTVRLNEKGLCGLLSISKNGLASYVESIVVDTNTLIKARRYRP